MDEKKIQSEKESHTNKLSGSPLNLIKIITAAALLATIFVVYPTFGQSTVNTNDLKKKNTLGLLEKKQTTVANVTHKTTSNVLVEKNGNTYHKKIINSTIQNILREYGQVKWMEIIKKHLLIEINNARAKKWSPAMKFDTALTTIAQEHAQDMKDNNYLDHEDSHGKHVWDRAKSVGYTYSDISENIANGETIESVVSWFIHSKKGGHEIILSDKYTQIGFGIAWTYFVFDFASPLK